ncbi:nitroreductase family protein [Methanoculleus sp. FWC-SCC1]|uniref:Nitroreductase family protein n=2 Tax=Methanoculleus frigidifontis TaxID=2584085 RepID=A0ABT8M8M5_9EURY|nr:nitroreductase family protein [Methanoculleus sp. FWC-SCC1]
MQQQVTRTAGEGDAEAVIGAINGRRSIREYEKRDLAEETVRRLIDAGVQAPTGLGFQPWRFVVVRDRDLMREVSEYCKKTLTAELAGVDDESTQRFLSLLKQEGFNIFYNAPVLVLVFGAADDPMSSLDCTLCAENMMLAAWSLGVGSCWIGSASVVARNSDLMERLQAPEGYNLVAPLIFGYPAAMPEKPERRDPVITRVG